MIGRRTANQPGAGQSRGAWPVLLLLLAAALVPSGCVLWFMNAAMTNERLAVREKLTQAYNARLLEARQQVDEHWDRHAAKLSALAGEGPGQTFARLAKSGKADSFLVLDEDGSVAYPNNAARGAGVLPAAQETSASQPAGDADSVALMSRAEYAEFALGLPAQAADLYGQAAEQAADDPSAARALLAQARCLAKAGRRDQALALLTERLESDRFGAAMDIQNRLISAAGRLLALEIMGRDDSRFAAASARLIEQVNDYGDLSMPAGQRVFIMTRLAELAPAVSCPTLLAELACQGLSEGLRDFDGPPSASRLMSSYTGPLGKDASIDNLRSALLSTDQRVYGLFSGQRVIDEVETLLNRGPVTEEAAYRLVSSVVPRPDVDRPFLQAAASDRHMSDWSLALLLKGEDPFAAAAAKRNAAYLWTAGAGIAFIAILAAALAAYLNRQIHLTRLKNDLIATVSHELKTPLASMRVLVDTLREGRCRDERQAGEYLDLIARENERLSRLIDNFLAFSRMERNKRAFEFAPVDVADVVHVAVAAVGDRFTAPDAILEVHAPADLPRVQADRDALVTVLLNLLDNAWKYTGNRKAVQVRTYAADGAVSIEVADNGVGISRRAARRIFDRFYQVDQTLARKAGGCGLGLAIVKFILDAHGGSVRVKSQPGKGSVFTVRLPAAEAPLSGNQEPVSKAGELTNRRVD